MRGRNGEVCGIGSGSVGVGWKGRSGEMRGVGRDSGGVEWEGGRVSVRS